MAVKRRDTKNSRRLVDVVEPLLPRDYSEALESALAGFAAAAPAVLEQVRGLCTARIRGEHLGKTRDDAASPLNLLGWREQESMPDNPEDADGMFRFGATRAVSFMAGRVPSLLTPADRARMLAQVFEHLARALEIPHDAEDDRTVREFIHLTWSSLYGTDPLISLLQAVDLGSRFLKESTERMNVLLGDVCLLAVEQGLDVGELRKAGPTFVENAAIAHSALLARGAYSFDEPERAARMDLELARRAIVAWSVRGRQKKLPFTKERARPAGPKSKWQTIRALAVSCGLPPDQKDDTIRDAWKKFRALKKTAETA